MAPSSVGSSAPEPAASKPISSSSSPLASSSSSSPFLLLSSVSSLAHGAGFGFCGMPLGFCGWLLGFALGAWALPFGTSRVRSAADDGPQAALSSSADFSGTSASSCLRSLPSSSALSSSSSSFFGLCGMPLGFGAGPRVFAEGLGVAALLLATSDQVGAPFLFSSSAASSKAVPISGLASSLSSSSPSPGRLLSSASSLAHGASFGFCGIPLGFGGGPFGLASDLNIWALLLGSFRVTSAQEGGSEGLLSSATLSSATLSSTPSTSASRCGRSASSSSLSSSSSSSFSNAF
mmetsp:Transcript_94643/g.267172  ORF Transcript_94643/g.267172 Transcript_94643/m.267172 type:complete len:292 (-) Transcript_94643:184-1059(-)